jgi:protein-S-isoprenylcysteine O-methyltransferase Ste14
MDQLMRDRLGLAFFTFATTLSAFLAWEQPSLLAWLVTIHNAILAGIYARRQPARAYDRIGLGLGLLAAFLPLAAPYPESIPVLIIVVGCLGYGLVFWSLFALGSHFGVAPADRGLITRGPYRLVRHPMYLGELILRAALLVGSPQPVLAGVMLFVLITIQILRIQREERIIRGYDRYAVQVRFRLVPGVW